MSLYVVDGYWVNGYTVTEELYGRAWWLRQRPKQPIPKRKPAAIELPEPEPEIPPNPQEIPAVWASIAASQSAGPSGDPPPPPAVRASFLR